MKNSSKARWCTWLAFGLFTLLVFSALGPIMREGDQASLIDGSLQIARSGEIWQQEHYNYNRQFGSYWLLGVIFRVVGLAQLDASPDAIVFAGNLVAALALLLGMALALWREGPRSWPVALPWMAVFASPVILFSAPLLSSNLLSAGVLLALAVVLVRRGNGWGDLGALVLGFLAVALRADAVLVMPLLAFASTPAQSLKELIGDRRVIAVAVGSLAALAVGSLVGSGPSSSPMRFFDWRTFGPYMLFGLCGLLLLWLLYGGTLMVRGLRKRSLMQIGMAVALLVPIGFYGGVLYTPRHLVTTCLVILLTCLFSRGREHWSELAGNSWSRCLGYLGLAASVVPFFVGASLVDMKSGSLVLKRPTLYPTADGLWPMGGNYWFIKRLGDAGTTALDHNQRVWSAWLDVEAGNLPKGPLYVESSGLRSFGRLRLTMLGRESLPENVGSPTVLTDGRSVLKARIGVTGAAYGGGERSVFDGAGFELGRGYLARVYVLDAEALKGDESWEVLRALRKIGGGDEYLLGRAGETALSSSSNESFRWRYVWPAASAQEAKEWQAGGSMKMWPQQDEEEWLVFDGGVSAKSFPAAGRDLPEDAWIARSALPAFMSVEKYRK